jgi:hypothetical protein
MMTSNRPLEDWGKLLGDVPSATAILDRFLHHAQVVAITGKSNRLRHQAQDNEHPAGDSHEPSDESNPAISPPGSKKPKRGEKNEQRSDETSPPPCQS